MDGQGSFGLVEVQIDCPNPQERQGAYNGRASSNCPVGSNEDVLGGANNMASHVICGEP